MSAPAAIMVIIRTMAAVDECRRSLPGMGHDFFDDVAPSTIFLAPVAMWRSDWEWAQRGASVRCCPIAWTRGGRTRPLYTEDF